MGKKRKSWWRTEWGEEYYNKKYYKLLHHQKKYDLIKRLEKDAQREMNCRKYVLNFKTYDRQEGPLANFNHKKSPNYEE